ncbi:MAG: CPBP family intramembrane metalloprotease [Methanobacterium sp.]|nr:CPBP family intramembrane metalloprotease [Methanobacterium sp.]
MVNEAVFESIKVRYLLLWLIGFFIIMGIIFVLTTDYISDAEWDVATGFLFYIIISLWIIWNFKRVHINYQKFIGYFPFDYNWLFLFIIIFAVIILSLGLGELSRYIISQINPNLLNHLPSTSFFYTSRDTPLAPFLNFMDFIIAVIMAPIVEEFLFRGVILHRFTVKWGIKWGVLVSSIIFGFLHSDIIGAFIFALVMCILYIKTACILVPILAHMINNLLAYGTQILSTLGPQSTIASHNLVVAAVLLFISVVIILYFLYRNWPQRYWRPPYFQEVYDGIPENLYYDED